MIITCPNCRTRYRVAADAISAVGRKVQCAACHEEWVATPSLPMALQPLVDPEPDADETAFSDDNDTLFTDADEALLDARFESVAETVAESPVGVEVAGFATVPAADNDSDDPDEDDDALADDHAARRKAHAVRRRKIDRSMPLARFRRTSRLLILLAFAALVTLVFGFRAEIIRAYPEFGVLFESVGLGTNVVGLDFSGVRTLRTTRDGTEVLLVTATLTNVTGHLVDVPPVVVSLIDRSGLVVYEWSVTPGEGRVAAGASVPLETRLSSPPPDIERVRLTFAFGQNRVEPGVAAGH